MTKKVSELNLNADELASETEDKPVRKSATAKPKTTDYTVQAGDDIAKVFASDYESVTSDQFPTPQEYVLAYNAGYMLRTNKGVAGWSATKR